MSFNLATAKVLSIGNKQYTVKYPNVGQILEIENRKQVLSDGKYMQMVMPPRTHAMRYATNLIDAIAHFSVLIPELTKDLSVGSYQDIDAITGKALIDVYVKEFSPWYEALVRIMYDLVEEVEADKDTEGSDAASQD